MSEAEYIKITPSPEMRAVVLTAAGLADDGTKWYAEQVLRRQGLPVIGDTRACPDCGRPQHYTGTELGWAHDAQPVMTADQAREYRDAHDTRAREFTRMSKATLADLRAARLRADGVVSYGGPPSKDELIRELLEQDYPIARLNESIHVLHHKPGEFWSACKYCVPTIGATRACPGCGRPQHYTGTELGWCHDVLIDTWHCADSRKAGA